MSLLGHPEIFTLKVKLHQQEAPVPAPLMVIENAAAAQKKPALVPC